MRKILIKFKNFYNLVQCYYQEFIESNDIKKFKIPLTIVQNNFYSANLKHWQESNKFTNGDLILIEGLTVEYGPNYLYRTGLIAKAIEELHPELTPAVIYDDFAYTNKTSVKLYESFQIKKFVFLRRNMMNIFFSLKAKYLVWGLRKKLKNGNDILNLEFRNILYGDLLYDELIHGIPGCKTINKMEERYYPYLYMALFSFLKYDYFFKKNAVKYYVSTHCCYLQFGILCRIALKNKAHVIITTDIDVTYIDPKPKKPRSAYSPIYHEFVLEYIQKQLIKNEKATSVIRSQKYLEDRFAGNIKQVDVQLAYSNKLDYDLEQLCSLLGLPLRKTYFIMTHIVSDAPHSSPAMIYKDYYEWLERTIDICSRITHVNWIIKAHPAAKVYKEETLASDMLAKYDISHVKMCPLDFNSSSLVKCASGILSVQGTAGLEFACTGIPIILTGAAFYSDFGFTINCKTEAEYIRTLTDIDKINPLNQNQIEQALMVLDAFRSYSLSDNLVLDADTLMHVWGYKERNIPLVFERMSQKLLEQTPQKEPQYLRCQEMVST